MQFQQLFVGTNTHKIRVVILCLLIVSRWYFVVSFSAKVSQCVPRHRTSPPHLISVKEEGCALVVGGASVEEAGNGVSTGDGDGLAAEILAKTTAPAVHDPVGATKWEDWDQQLLAWNSYDVMPVSRQLFLSFFV